MVHIETAPHALNRATETINWSEAQWRFRPDCETAVALRQIVAPLFSIATSWAELRNLLRGRGYDLGFEDGRLILLETTSGRQMCSCRFLGHPLMSLVARFGKLRARPQMGSGGFGDALV